MAIEAALIKPVVDALMALFRESNDIRLKRNAEAALREAIRRSWQLNCALDSGTCPPQVARITEAIEPFGAAYKLLGAGGGGYLLILAPDLAAAAGIKDALLRHPPNPQARFVAMAVSRTGMQITRS